MKLAKDTCVKLNDAQRSILGHLCYAASKLWNVGNYERKNWSTLGLPNMPSWYGQKKALKSNMWFKSLPSQSAQEVLKDLSEGWKSCFALLKTGGIANPHAPGYKQSNMPVTYMQNGIANEKGSNHVRLSLPKALKKHLRDKYDIHADYLWIENELFGSMNAIKQITLYPAEDGACRVIVVYEIPDVAAVPDNGHYLSLDPGVHNLLTFVDSDGGSGILGRKYLQIDRNCHRKASRIQSEWYSQQAAQGVRYPKSSKHIQAAYDRRNTCMKDYLHKVTHWIADYCVQHEVSRVVIGDITGIRKDKDYGHLNNQKLHSWPFRRIMNMLQYKLALHGIVLAAQDEAYTSQCSPLAPEVSKKHAKASGRVKRGLYKDGSMIWNADAVGAFNILRKWLKEEHPGRVLNPKIIGTPTVIKVAV